MSPTPVSLRTLFADLEVELHGCELSTTIESICSDSREAKRGAAFVASAGVRGDGHQYIAAAEAKGASLVIAQRGACDAPTTAHAWLQDSAAALPILAANFFAWPARSMTTYGLTGTNGKTTCSFLLASILEAAGHRYARLGTTGNWLADHEVKGAFTTPFPIELQGMLAEARERAATHAVLEVSSHALAQGRALPIAFDAVAMTSFSQDHLDYHADMEDYLRAKLRLCEEQLQAGGLALAPVDGQPAADRFLAQAQRAGGRVLRLSRSPDTQADYRVLDREHLASGTTLHLQTPGGVLSLQSPLIGDFNEDNLMVAAALALETGIDPSAVREGLRHSQGAPGRLERVTRSDGRGPRVYVDYAHTPDAVARALEVLRARANGRVIVVLGCGGDRDRAKRPLMGRAAFEGSDLFWASSDNPRSEEPDTIIEMMIADLPRDARVRVQADRALAIGEAIAVADDDDLVLIAGKGHEQFQIIGDKKLPFDDRDHARQALERR